MPFKKRKKNRVMKNRIASLIVFCAIASQLCAGPGMSRLKDFQSVNLTLLEAQKQEEIMKKFLNLADSLNQNELKQLYKIAYMDTYKKDVPVNENGSVYIDMPAFFKMHQLITEMSKE